MNYPRKKSKIIQIRRLYKKLRRQGAQIMRSERTFTYASMKKDAVQRSIRTFYEAVFLDFLKTSGMIPQTPEKERRR
jgi:hypothetical protein